MNTKTFNTSIKQIQGLQEEMRHIINASQELSPKGDFEDFLTKINETENRLKNQIFQVAVMAMMKSGKSTFINALLGKEFLPMSNVPETAVAVTIRHSNDPKHKEGVLLDSEGVLLAKGKNISQKLIDLNEEKRSKGKDSKHLILKAPLQYLIENNKPLDLTLFEVVDTPGFGEAEVEMLKKNISAVSEDILENIGVIIYLLDYTKLKSGAEHDILGKLQNMRSDLLDRIKDRLFFVINKVDQANHTSLTSEETIDYVVKIFKKDIPKIERTNIMTVSANRALLARLVISETASPKALHDFAKEVFGYKAENKTIEDCKNEADDFLKASKLPDLETTILEHIYQNRGRLLLETLISDLERIIKNFQNTEISTPLGVARGFTAGKSEFKKQKVKMGELQRQIENVKKKFEELNKVKSSKNYVIPSITLSRIFNKYKDAELIPDAFKVIDTLETRVKNKEDAKKLMDRIFEQISSTFRQIQKRLENDIIEEQSKLLNNFEKTARELTLDFQNKVSETLNINLDPLPFSTIEINIDVVKSNFYNLSEILQDAKEETKHREEYWKRGGLCSSGYYASRVVTKQIDVFDIKKDVVKKKIEESVNEMTDYSITGVLGFLRNVVNERINKTVSEFTKIADKYQDVIKREIDEISMGGEKYIEERIKQLEHTEANVNKILDSLKNVKSFIQKEEIKR